MRKQTVTIVLMTLLAGMVLGGCGGRVTEPKLVRADSLMDAAPDSALALLLTIDSTRLDGRANQAYYALLLTQARYKCYIPATGDSLINIAVDYYRHHGGRDCRVRSLAYKGCVMEEIGNVEDALRYYKEATAIAEKEDHKNQGFLKLRMAMLYQTSNTVDSADVLNLKEALGHYTELGDKHYMMVCARQLGMDYMQCDSAKHYLSIALLLSRELCDTASYNLTLLGFAEHDALNSHDYSSALNHIRQIEDIATPNPETDEISLLAALSWAKLGRKDSSELYLSKTKRVTSLPDSLIFLETTAELAKMSGDMEKYAQLTTHRYKKADSAMLASLQIQLADVEHKYDNQLLNAENQRIKNQNFRMLLSLGALALLTLFLAYVYQKLKGKYQLHVIESQNIRLELSQAQIELDRMVKKNTDATRAEEELKGLAATSFVVSELMKRMKVNPKNKSEYATKNKTIFQIIDSLIKEQMLSFDNLDEQFWQSLYIAVNYKCLGIVTYVKEKYPHLTEKDLHLLALCCSDFSVPVISQCLGYTNVKTLSNNKIKFMREKLGLNQTLADFKSDYITRMRKNRVSHKSV